jgi:hypothetical protein
VVFDGISIMVFVEKGSGHVRRKDYFADVQQQAGTWLKL